jgi:hypothetical protein
MSRLIDHGGRVRRGKNITYPSIITMLVVSAANDGSVGGVSDKNGWCRYVPNHRGGRQNLSTQFRQLKVAVFRDLSSIEQPETRQRRVMNLTLFRCRRMVEKTRINHFVPSLIFFPPFARYDEAHIDRYRMIFSRPLHIALDPTLVLLFRFVPVAISSAGRAKRGLISETTLKSAILCFS